MPSVAHNIRLIESLEKRLQSVQYQDFDTLSRLCTEVRIVLRRAFGEEHVYAHDFEQIRFRPEGFIANSEHYRMTGAWKQGCADLTELLRAMKTELSVYGASKAVPGEITIAWLARNMTWELWTALGTIIVTAFSAGVALASTTFVKELLGR